MTIIRVSHRYSGVFKRYKNNQIRSTIGTLYCEPGHILILKSNIDKNLRIVGTTAQEMRTQLEQGLLDLIGVSNYGFSIRSPFCNSARVYMVFFFKERNRTILCCVGRHRGQKTSGSESGKRRDSACYYLRRCQSAVKGSSSEECGQSPSNRTLTSSLFLVIFWWLFDIARFQHVRWLRHGALAKREYCKLAWTNHLHYYPVVCSST